MKNLKIVILAISLLIIGFAFSSCGGSASIKAGDTEQQGKEYTSAYICPMHCEGSGSDAAGTCPVCGMDYVKNEKHGHEGHDH